MSSSLEAFQIICRSISGTSGTVNEDFHAAASANAIDLGAWGERIIAYARLVDPVINDAGAAWNFFLEDPTRLILGIATFYFLLEDASGSLLLEDGSFLLLESA